MRQPDEALPTPAQSSPEMVLAQLDGLPTLASVAVRLLQMTSSSAAGARDVAEVLRADQSLTAKILSVANSAASAAREPIVSLPQAVARLGLDAVRRIVLAVKVFECFGPDRRAPRPSAFDRVGFWKHALGVACVCKRIAEARSIPGVRAEDAFVAGLLHDLGKVALHAVFPKAYDRIAGQTEQERGDIADNERMILGIDHTIAGRRIAERWKLPRMLREVIWLHHLAADALPSSVAAGPLIALVQLADTLVREQRVGYSGNHVFFDQSAEMARRLGLDAGQLAAIAARLVDDVTEQAALLDLDRETPQAMYFEALSRANTELGRLNDDLRERNRKLAAGARYFRAQAQCDAQLDPAADLRSVVVALAMAGVTAFQRPRLAAFALRDDRSGIDVAWYSAEGESGQCVLPGADDELLTWMGDIGGLAQPAILRAPRAVQRIFSPIAESLGVGELWLVLVAHDGRLLGGFAFISDSDERVRLSDEAEELRAFAASAALAIGRANAQSAARRLSDDLADTNRRLQHMQSEVLRTRTLSMIAEMAAGAGHELNNPLAVISGRAQILADQLEDPEMLRSLMIIQEKAHDCSRIVTELMDFARPRAPQLQPTPISTLLESVRAVWEAEPHATTISLTVTGEEGLPDVSIDREQIAVVFRELLRNAVHALGSERGGRIAVSARLAGAGDAVEILVRDTGPGMPPNVQQRAFDPFYSYRAAGRGRGLGLPRASRIIEAHTGRIWLESYINDGTTAHIVLPPAVQK